MTPFSTWVKTFPMLWRRRRPSPGPRKVTARYDESVLSVGTESGRASTGNDGILALENQVLDLLLRVSNGKSIIDLVDQIRGLLKHHHGDLGDSIVIGDLEQTVQKAKLMIKEPD